MRKIFYVALAGMVATSILLCGCAPKTTEALKEAEAAIAEAKDQSASQKVPQLFEQAEKHLAQGKDYQANFRNGLARAEYEAATADARLAMAIAAPEGTECPVCPALPEDPGGCCLELNAANSEIAKLKNQLSDCRSGAYVRTKYIREPCEEGPAEPATTVIDKLLLGTLTLTPPKGLIKGKEDYQIKVNYTGAMLEDNDVTGTRAENDYRILIDIAGAEPAGVEVFSPTADFEPISTGEWVLPVNVPEDVSGPVEVKVVAMLRNTATGKEQTLPESTVVIPDGRACPECPECPAAAPVKAKSGANWFMRILLLLVGLIGGLIVGFVAFRKKKSTI